MFSSWVPASLRYIFTPSYGAFTNIMACRAFRIVALGIIEDPALSTKEIDAAFRSAPVAGNEVIMMHDIEHA